MVITLEDIRNAAKSYVNTKVTRQITITPSSGAEINVDEVFSVRITVTNPAPAQGGIKLKNVRYHVRIPNFAMLRKPTAAVGVARNGPDPTSTLIPDSSFPVSNMWIHPTNDLKILDTPDTDEITLTGVAKNKGKTEFRFRMLAMPDIEYLLGNDLESDPVSAGPLDIQE